MPRRVLLALALAVATVAPAAAEPVRLSPEALLQSGEVALDARRPDVALRIAEALLARDPNDWQALLLQSRAARDLGQYDLARSAARQAWRLAETGPRRYASALARAQAEASGDRRTRAQFWLRRAIQDAPDDLARALAVRDFRYVRARNPLRLNLGFSVAPSSNINGGSSAETLLLYGIPFTLSGDAQALSGIETRLSLGADYRLRADSRDETRAGLNLTSRLYALSSEAKRQAPEADADDYAFGAVEVFLSHKSQPETWRAPWDMRLTLGHNTYGGQALSNYARFDFGKDFKLEGRQVARLSAGLERQWRLDQADRSATIRSVEARYGREVPGGGLNLGVGASQVQSASSSIDHLAFSLNADYRLAKPIAGAELGLHFEAETRDYARSPYDPAGREDLRLSLGVSALLRKQDYMGFAPEISLNASRTNSTISLFDSTDLGLGLNLRSAF